jgi:hypothetical protein
MSKLFYYESKDKGTKIQQALDYIDQAKEFIKSEEARLIQSTIGINNKIMPIKTANQMGKICSVGQYKTYDLDINNELRSKSGYFNKPNNVEQTCSNALRHAEYLYKQSEAIHEENIIALENNIALKDYVYAFMEKIGIPKTITTYDYISSSGRRVNKQQEHRHCAGYTKDIDTFLKTDDGFSYATTQLENVKKNIEAYRLAETKKEQEAQKLIDAENANKEETKLLATLVVKYGLDYQSTFQEVLDEILGRNKYLELGYWLERQRNDWSDGFWKAKNGIDGFTVVTDLDKRIQESLYETLSECEDGRDFRDCQYNYSELYSMVEDEDLYKDYELVQGKIDY